MELIFLKIVNMSAAASWLILAVLLLRFILKKVPRAYICVLWAMVGIRLVLPFSFESKLSLLPSAEVFPEEFLYAAEPKINSGIGFIDNAVNPIIADGLAPEPTASANPAQINSVIFSWLWICGMAVMIVYMAASFIRIKLRVRESVPSGENVWFCDHVDTPFILGIIRPRIYLPSDIGENDAAYVVAHEKAHIKRLDFIWKPLGFLILAVHWFNPLVWLSYVLFCRDIEFACDERVVKGFSSDEKKEYSEALLNLSVPKHIISACPLAFGEVGVKERIKSVLSYKKPAFWVIIASMGLGIVFAVVFLTNPYTEKVYDKELFSFIDMQISEHTKTDYNSEMYRVWNTEILDIIEKDEKKTVYLWVYYGEYSSDYEGNAVCINLKKGPIAITAKKVNDDYELVDYRAADNMEIAKENFPSYLQGKLNCLYQSVPPIVESEIWDDLLNKANVHFKTLNDRYIMDSVMFDINGDGKEEYIVIAPGPTSGMYTISLGIMEKSANKLSCAYWNSYYIYYGYGDFEFDIKNGKLYIKHTERTGKVNIFDAVYDGTDILLFENGKQHDIGKIIP